MSGIYGFAALGQAGISPAASLELSAGLAAGMSGWGPDGGGEWRDDRCLFGHCLLLNTPEAVYERLPLWHPENRLAFTAEARIDNREELCDQLRIPHCDRSTTPDSTLILHAYLKWGEACPDHLLGDWSFAAWHPDERRLFLARDHAGNTSLVYCLLPGDIVVFASSPRALHAAGTPRRLNELYLAQVIVSWFAYHGPQTIDLDIQRLPPAYALHISPAGIHSWRYWRLEDTPELHLPTFEAYASQFLEVYREAVRCRLRSYRPVGATLSGGLDSGSVTALAAHELAAQDKRLPAYTSVPRYGTFAADERHLEDETTFAAATASMSPGVDHRLLDSARVTPFEGIRRMLAIVPEPSHAASNFYWLLDLLEHVHSDGIGTLLTGQGGNATVSWTGAPELRSLPGAARYGGWKAAARYVLPSWALKRYRARPMARVDWSHTAISPAFAARLDLAQRRIAAIGADPALPESWRTPRDKRCAILLPGANRIGDLWAQMGAYAGIEVRDPTIDKRVQEFTFAVPDPCFDSPDGLDRWLIRSAMDGLLPNRVRLTTKRGVQASDLVARLRSDAAHMETALAALSTSAAVDYINVDALRRTWAELQAPATLRTTHLAVSVLLRGIMAGFFLKGNSAADVLLLQSQY